MGNNHTTLSAKSKDHELTVSQTTTDAPILPVAQLERLQQIAPDRVPWIFEETQKEAEFRRAENRRINTFIFIERVIGQLFGLLIGVGGLFAAVYAATHGAEAAGSIIGGATLVGLVSAFLYRAKIASKQSKSDK